MKYIYSIFLSAVSLLWMLSGCVEDPDMDTFLGLPMAIQAAKAGGSMPTVFNAANELAVSKFLHKKIRFLDIYDIIGQSMERHKVIENPGLEEILETESDTYQWIESRG